MVLISYIFIGLITLGVIIFTKRFHHIEKKDIFGLFLMGLICFLLIKTIIYGDAADSSLSIAFLEISFGPETLKDKLSGVIKESPFVSRDNLIILIYASIEEISKLACLIFYHRFYKNIHNTRDAIFSIIYISLGFAFIESMFYVLQISQIYLQSADILNATISRNILLLIGHSAFSLILGYTYGKSLFHKYHIIDYNKVSSLQKINRYISFFVIFSILMGASLIHTKQVIGGSISLLTAFSIILFQQSQKKRTIYSTYFTIYFLGLGIIFSSLFHGGYNILMENGQKLWAIMLVYVGLMLLSIIIRKIYSQKVNYLQLNKKIELLKIIKKNRDTAK